MISISISSDVEWMRLNHGSPWQNTRQFSNRPPVGRRGHGSGISGV
jgi:hypothetical protein